MPATNGQADRTDHRSPDAPVAPAAFILVAGWNHTGGSVLAFVYDLTTGHLVAALAVVLLGMGLVGGAVLLQVLQQHGRLLVRLEAIEDALRSQGVVAPFASGGKEAGLPVGAKAPDFVLPDLHGRPVGLRSLLGVGTPVMLFFTDPGCGPCTAMLSKVAGWAGERTSELMVCMVSRGGAAANRLAYGESGVTVLLQEDREVGEVYGTIGTPTAVLLRPDGTVGSDVAAGEAAIERLVNETADPLALTLVEPAARPPARRPPVDDVVAPPSRRARSGGR